MYKYKLHIIIALLLVIYFLIGCGFGIFGQFMHDLVCKFIFTYMKYIIFGIIGFLIVYVPIMYDFYKKSLIARRKAEQLLSKAEKEDREKKILKNILND